MQTSFTDKQLTDEDNKSSESILRKCVHCGMCNATCPTFCVNGEELEGCLLYTSPSPRDKRQSRMPSSA